jgi:hypothetical protein
MDEVKPIELSEESKLAIERTVVRCFEMLLSHTLETFLTTSFGVQAMRDELNRKAIEAASARISSGMNEHENPETVLEK